MSRRVWDRRTMLRAKTRASLGVAVMSATLMGSSYALAEGDSEGEGDSAAMAGNRGLVFGLGPVLLLPVAKKPEFFGGGLDISLRYGIKAGPVVLAPGGMAAGYFVPNRFIGLGAPTFRITVPIGPLAPFVLAGVGGGWLSNPADAGLAMLGGGGLMVHFGRVFAIGGEVTYQTIRGTGFKAIAIGPSISFGG